ncbi:MAG TPA: flavodoxin family protein [Thermoplasmataceae archaeon]|nr:flavodoxin family protein [Thermoplasmataceae archaeon]
MKVIVVYDSMYGNTRKIAESISSAFDGTECIKTLHVEKATPEDLKGFSLIIIGSPTHGGRPTPAVHKFMDNLPGAVKNDVHFASFDTRFSVKEQGAGLRFLMRLIGYAAEKIDRKMSEKGYKPVVKPEAFIVVDKEGPLREGEEERARNWGKIIEGKIALHKGENVTEQTPLHG